MKYTYTITTLVCLSLSGLNAQDNSVATDSVSTATPENTIAANYLEETNRDWSASDRFGLGFSTGTLGLSLQSSYEVTDWFYVKAQIGGFPLSISQEVDGTDYDLDIHLFSGGATANFLPFHSKPYVNGFRVSVGAFGVNNNFGLEASSPGQELSVGDSADFVLGSGDKLVGDIELSGFAPYVGFGWDFTKGSDAQFRISFDLGVLFIGSPDVSLRAVGAFSDFAIQNPGINLQDEIDAEISSIQEDVDDIELYPVFSSSFTWKF